MRNPKNVWRQGSLVALSLAAMLTPMGLVSADTSDDLFEVEESTAAQVSQSGSETQAQENTSTEQEGKAESGETAAEPVVTRVRYYSKDDTFRRGDELVTNEWVDYYGERYYTNANGHPYRNRFLSFGKGSRVYYVGRTGIMQTGKVELGGKLYYFEPSGEKRGQQVKANAWVKTDEGWIFPNAQGVLYRNQLISFGSTSYYMNAEGVRATGKVATADGAYDLDATGKLIKRPHWFKAEGNWYYAKKDGQVYRNTFLSFGKTSIYLVGKNGAMQTGVTPFNGSVYNLGSNGKLIQKAQSYKYDGKYYFSKSTGWPYRNQLITFGSYGYYMGADGSRQYGLINAGKNDYYANPSSGQIKKNLGLLTIGGKTYHSGSSYALTRGWAQVNGTSMYFDSSASLPQRLENVTRTIGDVTYKFNAKGVPTKVETSIGESGEWAYDGRSIYGPAISTRNVGKNFIVVSLKHQYLWLVRDGKLALQTPVISGKPTTPTIRGNFKIQRMERNRNLIGPTWNSYVNYWVQFYGAYGIHDASWQRSGNFYKNSSAYTWTGSHGCVNISSAVMPKIWGLVYNGMPVTVY